MRTTVVIKEKLASQIKTLAKDRSLSEFINNCIEEHLKLKKQKELRDLLVKAYIRANEDVADDFENADREGWPEW
ncbi:MAG: hypothetical protein HY877_00425 [Deltaproteobacteria bacterium]|nr:hypothetical protein [Deltaproteobacteria bacterium]